MSVLLQIAVWQGEGIGLAIIFALLAIGILVIFLFHRSRMRFRVTFLTTAIVGSIIAVLVLLPKAPKSELLPTEAQIRALPSGNWHFIYLSVAGMACVALTVIALLGLLTQRWLVAVYPTQIDGLPEGKRRVHWAVVLLPAVIVLVPNGHRISDDESGKVKCDVQCE